MSDPETTPQPASAPSWPPAPPSEPPTWRDRSGPVTAPASPSVGAAPAPTVPPTAPAGVGGPPLPPGAGPRTVFSPPPAAGWPSAPPTNGGKRIAAFIMAVCLILASAGIGALVAVSVTDKPEQTVAFQNPATNNRPNGSPFGNQNPSTGNSNQPTLDTAAIAQKVIPSVVNITTTLDAGRAAGTGIIIADTGEILTNNHVIAGALDVKVDIGGTGDVRVAHVVGYDVEDDVALLQLEDKSNIVPAEIGDVGTLDVGDPVVAIGNALGRGGRPDVVDGTITGLEQQVTAGDQQGGFQETLEGMIQSNAPIQPGDSGGPLINDAGQVIGVNTAAAVGQFRQQSGNNIGFSIPIDDALSIISQIRSGDESNGVHIGPRALLGVQVESASAGTSAPTSSGALVIGVEDDSAAASIGIKEGDVVVSIDGKRIEDDRELHLMLTEYHPGDEISVGIIDTNGDAHTLQATLKEGPPA
jgi:S1-C subfamily serine protease